MYVPIWIPIGLIVTGIGLAIFGKDEKDDSDDSDDNGDSAGDKPGSSAVGKSGQGSVGSNDRPEPADDNHGNPSDGGNGQPHAVESVHPAEPLGAENHVNDETDGHNDSPDDGNDVATESSSSGKPESAKAD